MRRLVITNSYGLEIWQDIPQYEGKYQASTLGRIKSLNYHRTGKEKVLKQDDSGTGYLKVDLQPTKEVHSLVAKTWLPSRGLDQTDVNHKDENKHNNRVENLEWCTKAYNNKYGTRLKKVSKVVLQFDKQGNFIAEYPSTAEAARQTGIYQASICACCNGKRKSAGGFVWKYK